MLARIQALAGHDGDAVALERSERPQLRAMVELGMLPAAAAVAAAADDDGGPLRLLGRGGPAVDAPPASAEAAPSDYGPFAYSSAPNATRYRWSSC